MENCAVELNSTSPVYGSYLLCADPTAWSVYAMHIPPIVLVMRPRIAILVICYQRNIVSLYDKVLSTSIDIVVCYPGYFHQDECYCYRLYKTQLVIRIHSHIVQSSDNW
jgi:hypothetical protein